MPDFPRYMEYRDHLSRDLKDIKDHSKRRELLQSEQNGLRYQRARVNHLVDVASRVQEAKEDSLFALLQERFENNQKLHPKIQWNDVARSLSVYPEKLKAILWMEETGGHPDVIGEENGEFIFGDCSPESPEGRRRVSFDKEAQEFLKTHYHRNCEGNATDLAAEHGLALMDKPTYLNLDKKIRLDKKSWSWVQTPRTLRNHGWALAGSSFQGLPAEVRRRVSHDFGSDGGFRTVVRVAKE